MLLLAELQGGHGLASAIIHWGKKGKEKQTRREKIPKEEESPFSFLVFNVQEESQA